MTRTALFVDEWQGYVYIRPLDARDMEAIERSSEKRATTIIRCTVDERGLRIFNDTDIEAVARKSSIAIERIYRAMRLWMRIDFPRIAHALQSQPERRFRIRLAGYLGKFPHEIDAMPLEDFYECMIAESIELFGERRTDYLAGLIASIIANVNRDPDKTEAFKPLDFIEHLYSLDQVEKPQTSDQQLAVMKLMKMAQDIRMQRRAARAAKANHG